MNHSHHDHCDHVLKYCSKCDVVYCTKCNEEWPKSQPYWHYYYGNPSITYTLGSTYKTANTTTTANTAGSCPHG